MTVTLSSASTVSTPPAILDLLRGVQDRRQPGKTLYPLDEILFVAFAGTLAGMNGWKEIAAFAALRREWLARYLPFANGVPDDEVLRRVLSALAPPTIEPVLRAWSTHLANSPGLQLHVDGKALRGAKGVKGPLHLLHVWASKYGVMFAQRAVEGAPGESPAVPDLLSLLDVRGATVTGDANFCTQANAEATRKERAHYLFALKGNRRALHAAVQNAMRHPARLRARGIAVDNHIAVNTGYGRRERRTVWAVEAKDLGIVTEGWKDLRSVFRIERERTSAGGEVQIENHYYISSHAPDARVAGRRIRRHWSVENECHWHLDVAFGEDRCQVRNQNGAQVLAVFRRIALMKVKRDTTLNAGVAIWLKIAAVDPEYLSHLLNLGIKN